MSLTDENEDGNNSKELDLNAFRKMHNKAVKIGYSDGIAAGSDSVFQLGFDKGYADGLHTGFHLEKYRSFSATVHNSPAASEELNKEATIYGTMNLQETIKSEHFQYTKHQNKSIEEISNHQKLYVEKQLQEFEGKLPNTYNLFSLKN